MKKTVLLAIGGVLLVVGTMFRANLFTSAGVFTSKNLIVAGVLLVIAIAFSFTDDDSDE